MRVLLTDGSGLTSKQVSHRLSQLGHQVEVLAPSAVCLSRFTRHVDRIHPVPRFGIDPWAWLEAALAVWVDGDFDVLFPTQEQVAVLSCSSERLAALGVATAVPPFAGLVAVQDKVSAHRTLERLGLRHPDAVVVTSAGQLIDVGQTPAFVKRPIGTATSGVYRVSNGRELERLAAALDAEGVFEEGPVLVQAPVAGPLVMVQAVFDHGELVAWHGCERTAEGINGGASHKRGLDLPTARGDVEELGRGLAWHGALSADVILGESGPVFIDLNPRLVEPANALASGVDLVGVLLAVAGGGSVHPIPMGTSGVRTHQLLLAVLGAAHREGRTGVASELVAAALHGGLYSSSSEELSPTRGDPAAALPVVAAAVATLVRPSLYSWFVDDSVTNYALTPGGWQAVVDVSVTGASAASGPDWPR